MTGKEQILKTSAGMTDEQIKEDSFYYSKSAMLSAMDEYAKRKAIEFLDWVKNYEGEQKIILCDNDFYWESDDEGDSPMGGGELMEIFQNIKPK